MTQDLGVGSHVPVLASAVNRTSGPVLELGSGHWSTHMLRLMCGTDRRLESYDNSEEWAKLMGSTFVPRWDRWEPKEERYGVIFIDCSPGEERKHLAAKLKDRAKFIILHDAECDTRHGGGGNYCYDDIYSLFRYVQHYRAVRPVTAILSNEEMFQLG